PEAEQLDHEEHVRDVEPDLRSLPATLNVRQELDPLAGVVRVFPRESERRPLLLRPPQVVEESLRRLADLPAEPLPLRVGEGLARVRDRAVDVVSCILLLAQLGRRARRRLLRCPALRGLLRRGALTSPPAS